MQQNKKSVLILGLLLLLSLCLSLPLFFSELLSHWHSTILGDHGDGFFVMWVMRHNIFHLLNGELSSILNGRIFFPDAGPTMLFSETLFVPTVIFLFSSFFDAHIFGAFNLTVLISTFLTLAAHAFLLAQMLPTAEQPKDKRIRYLLIFLFATIGTFNLGRQIYYVHFQNLFSFFLILQVGGAYQHLKNDDTKGLHLMMIGFVAVTYSALYFAVLGSALLFFWGWIFLFAKGVKETLRFAKSKGWVIALYLAPVAALSVLYGKQHKESALIWPIHAQFRDLYTPPNFAYIRQIVAPYFKWPLQHHEIPMYLGLSLILLLLVITASKLSVFPKYILTGLKHKFVWAFMFGYILTGYFRWISPEIGAQIGWLTIAMLVFGSMALFARATEKRKGNVGLVMIIFSMLITYEICFGTQGVTTGTDYDVSVWGVFVKLLPGMHKIRVVSRFGPVALSFLLALVALWFWLKISSGGRHKNWWIAFAISFCILFQVEHFGKIRINSYESKTLRPSPEETLELNKIQGPLASFPTAPFFINTWIMHYVVELPNIHLVNGYSGQNRPSFLSIMKTPVELEPNCRQLEELKNRGIHQGIILKPLLSGYSAENLQPCPVNFIYENEKIKLFSF